MKVAIWTVTRGAGYLGNIVKGKINATLYTLKKFSVEDSIQMDDFTSTLEDNFNKYDGHIFIMATGIVVRKISKLIKSKDIDPAVAVIDEGMNFVISLLSGHLGGANEMVNELAEKLSLVAIITTSSDVTGKIAVDTLSQKLKCQLESLDAAKKVTSLIVDGQNVTLTLPHNIVESGNSHGLIMVSNKEKVETVRLYPKNLVVGLGSRRGVETEVVLEAIKIAFEKNNLSTNSIKLFSTVDLKADEIGILEAVETFKKKLIIISRDEILKIEDDFEGSEFVKKEIGVKAVSEPCALLASNKDGKFIEKKLKYNGVTVSIYEERFGNEIW